MIVGCASQTINIDGKPISNHEYNLTNQETNIQIKFILAKYTKEYEGKEYIITPEYLDALNTNSVNPNNTEMFTFINISIPKCSIISIPS